MNTTELTSELSARLQLSKTKVGDLIEDTVNIITQQLIENNVVSVQNFGSFETKKRDERVSVNPSSGKRMLIPPRLVVSYKPATSLKDKIKEI